MASEHNVQASRTKFSFAGKEVDGYLAEPVDAAP